MTTTEPFWTAESAQHALDASRELERMSVLEETAELHDAEPLPLIREQYAFRYRQVIGVNPVDRAEYRAALVRIVAGGGMPVADVKIHLNRR